MKSIIDEDNKRKRLEIKSKFKKITEEREKRIKEQNKEFLKIQASSPLFEKFRLKGEG